MNFSLENLKGGNVFYSFGKEIWHLKIYNTPCSVIDSILHQLFIVRFLGSMEVKSDDHPDVVYETMRQILAARAIHNIFRMTESHLLVTCDCLK